MRRYALRDDRWDRIRDLLSGCEGGVGVTARDNRLFVEAMLHRDRAGIPWRDLPERFGDWKNVHRRFSRWAVAGVWQRVLRHLASDVERMLETPARGLGPKGFEIRTPGHGPRSPKR